MIKFTSIRMFLLVFSLSIYAGCDEQAANTSRPANAGKPTPAKSDVRVSVNHNGNSADPQIPTNANVSIVNRNRNGTKPLPLPSGTPTPEPAAAPKVEIEEGQFSFPPPKPTTLAIKSNLNGVSVNKFFTHLEEELRNAGYNDERRKYFSNNDDFALVTQVERTDIDATVLESSVRWDDYVPFGCSLSQYLTCLISGKKSYYRAIAFVVTNDYKISPTPPSFETAENWINKGELLAPETNLGESQPATVLDKHYRAIALIYMFEYHSGIKEIVFKRNFPVSAEEQLKIINISFQN